ncbi:MAG TPA: DMT family transporter [Planctomycetota bacterium]
MTAAAGVLLALHFATRIASLAHTSVAASLVLVNTTPIWAGLLAPRFTGERTGRSLALGIGVAVLGAVVIGAGDFRVEGSALRGDLLALAGAVTLAGYVIAGRQLRRRLALMPYVVLCYGTAALVLLALALALAAGHPVGGYSAATYGWLIGIALVPQVWGHTSYNWALR